ncbi:MAG: hypothetical protein II901_03875 [Paludibacteraceae bacterium]|nr:hypothetical protein [Paludibacteraceae bacterium]
MAEIELGNVVFDRFGAKKNVPKDAFEEDFYVICHNHSFVSLLSSFLPYFLYRRISTRKEQSSPMPMPKAMMSQK